MQKVNIKLIEKFIKEKDTLKILVKNFSELMTNLNLKLKKDYILKSFTYEWYKSKKREIEIKMNKIIEKIY